MRELNTIANNIANINTNGFRREGAVFAEHFESLQGGDEGLSIATMSHRFVDFSAGNITKTNNPLDFAIDGDGFFLVEGGDGERLTRDGAFSLNAQGELVTASNARVLDESGGAIVIPPETTQINTSDDGVIFADGQAVGKLGVVTSDPAFLVREGQNLFRAETGYQPAVNVQVRQHAVEGSNVSPVTELARLIEVQRTYELSKNLTESENERIERTVRVLSQGQ